MKRLCACLFSAWLLTIEGGLAAEPLARYRFCRTIESSLSQPELAAIELDGGIWEAIGTDGMDLRIADRQGRAAPHLMRRAGQRETRPVRELRAAHIEALSHLEGNRVELTVMLEKDAEGANLISFITPLKDFEKSIAVWGLDAEGAKTLLVERARIFDYNRIADVRETAVELPEDSTAYRGFRIMIEDVVDETQAPVRWETRRYADGQATGREEHTRVQTRPFRMDAVRLYRQQLIEAGMAPRVAPQTFYSVTLQQEHDPAATVVEIEHDGSPLTALLLACSDGNFSRNAKVEVPIRRDGREAWRQIASGQFSRISLRKVLQESLRIAFPETRSLRYRLTLSDHDNPPLQELSVSGEGPVWQAVLLAEPEKTYTVYYGAMGRPQQPRYDLAPLERLLGQEHEPLVLMLGTARDNPHFQQTGFFAREQAMRMLFILAVIVMLIVLAAGLYRASRQIVKTEDPNI